MLATWIVVAALAGACEGPPAHSKPWRKPPPSDKGPTPIAGSAAAVAAQRVEAASKRAHSLRIRLEGEPSHLNPMIDPDVDTLRIAEDTIFETLLRAEPGPDAGGPGVLRAGLAESWRVSAGGYEIRVLVREGVKFHDGERFTVVDAQYSLDMARSAAVRSPRLREALADVITVELVGPRELRLLLRRPNGFVLRALAEVPMLPDHVYRTPGKPSALDRHPKNRAPVGTGPYRFVRWDKGERIVLARNETYWGSAPAVEELEFVIEPDAAKALTRAKRGEIDVVPALSPTHYPDQANAMVADFHLLRLRPARLRYVVLNVTQPPLDDARVRHAIALVVDRKKLTAELAHGMTRAVAGPVWPGGPGDGASPAAPGFDPSGAVALLDAAGWIDSDGDGVRERGGLKLRVALLAGADARGDAERDVVVIGLRKAGFVVEVRSGDPGVLRNRLKSGDFELAIIDWRARTDEDLQPLLGTGGVRNWGGYSSKPMDAALLAVETAWEPAARATRIVEVARLIAEDWPIVALYAADPIGLVHRRVRGLVVRDGWFSFRGLTLDPA